VPGLKTFGSSLEKANDSAVLAANQGLCNGFLAAGLIRGLVHRVPAFAFQIKTSFCSALSLPAFMARQLAAAGFCWCRRRPRPSRWSCSGWRKIVHFAGQHCLAMPNPFLQYLGNNGVRRGSLDPPDKTIGPIMHMRKPTI
jgi:hypothetical protein